MLLVTCYFLYIIFTYVPTFQIRRLNGKIELKPFENFGISFSSCFKHTNNALIV